MTDSNSSELSSVTDVDSSDLYPVTDTDSSEPAPGSDEKIALVYDTPNTTDMALIDCPRRNDALLSERNTNGARRLSNQGSASSPLENESDTASQSSYTSSCKNSNQNYNKCAVVWCTEKARKQFKKLFFVNFPRDKKNICEVWWKICGRCDPFNPMLKICSIHFKPTDFTFEMVRRNGKLYRQSVLKNSYIIPSLYLQSHEYTKLTRKLKSRVKDVRQTEILKKSKSTYVCVVQGCKKTSNKDEKSTLFFKFPLKNAFLLKKWLAVIGLPYWKPLKRNRICSDHFENYYITKTDNVYQLNKCAVPKIKPKNMFVLNGRGSSKIQFKKPIDNSLNPSDFGRLEFNFVDNDTLLVKEKKRKNVNDEKSDILNVLENELDQKLKDYEKVLEKTTLSNSKVMKNSTTTLLNSKVIKNNTTTLSNSTVIKNSDTEKPLLISLSESNVSNVEVISDDSNDIQESQDKTSLNLTKQYLESFEKEIAKEREVPIGGHTNPNNIEFEYVYMDIINDVNMNAGVMEVQPLCNTDIHLKEKEMMDKSANSIDIDLEYVFMGIVNDENMMGVQSIFGPDGSVKDVCDNTDIGLELETNNDSKKITVEPTNNTFTGFETKNSLKKLNAELTKNNTVKDLGLETKNNLKKKIAERMKNNIVKETPESIIYDQDLVECYGEMLLPYCDSNCQRKCYNSVPGPHRRQIFQQFRMIPNVTEQNCEIAKLVQVIMVENRGGDFERCPKYCLKTDKEVVNVCRTFFMNTLGIPECRLKAVLKPLNYTWYTNKDIALKANQPKQEKLIAEQMIITDFMKASLEPLDKDYNLFEPDSDTETSLENISSEEQEKVLLYIKSIPRILCVSKVPGMLNEIMFETSINVGHMYKTYYESCISCMVSPPCTKQQFIKLYNQYMKSYLKMV